MKKKSEGNNRHNHNRKNDPLQDPPETPEDASVETEHPAGPDLSAKLLEKEKEAAENYEKYLRAVADFENYKKYAAKERADILKYGNEKIIKDILPILDALDRAIHQSVNSKDVDAFIKGVKIIHEQLLDCLGKHGVKVIEAAGQPFNPDLHEALMLAESDQEEGTVLQEFEKGYTLHDRLLRAAKVSVSKQQKEEDQAGAGNESK